MILVVGGTSLLGRAVVGGQDTVELVSGGAQRLVTWAERWRYAELVLRARFEETSRQMRSLLDGLESVIPHARDFSIEFRKDAAEFPTAEEQVVGPSKICFERCDLLHRIAYGESRGE